MRITLIKTVQITDATRNPYTTRRVYTKTAQNQNGPQIFDMSKTAHSHD